MVARGHWYIPMGPCPGTDTQVVPSVDPNKPRFDDFSRRGTAVLSKSVAEVLNHLPPTNLSPTTRAIAPNERVSTQPQLPLAPADHGTHHTHGSERRHGARWHRSTVIENATRRPRASTHN